MKAFTLAEVLIVLGIIGLIADMTIPTLIGSYNKKVAEIRIKKFYTSMLQAVTLSEIDNGPVKDWDFPSVNNNIAQMKVWYEKYLKKYLLATSAEDEVFGEGEGYFYVYFNDGSYLALQQWNMIQALFYVKKVKKPVGGRDWFYFVIDKDGFHPYNTYSDGIRVSIINNGYYGCNEKSTTRAFCALLIQYDGWQIKDDYPIKF